MRKYFGTDGIRGIAGGNLLNLDFIIKLAKATSNILFKEKRVIIGRDTRISSDFIDMALSSAFSALGIDVFRAGATSTPALSFLTKFYNVSAGFMISASHNPFYDNGIKIFAKDGMKLSDSIEENIESHLNDEISYKENAEIGRIRNVSIDPYLQHLSGILPDLSGINAKFLIDCANGSASRIIKELFDIHLLKSMIINAEPSGTNINENCGSLFIENLKQQMRYGNFDFGISFDGDADRCLILDGKGRVIDGDRILAIFSVYMKRQGKLKNNSVVVTTMSNLGLHNLLKSRNISVTITDVGDRYVLKKMLANGIILGGEQSGHIINGMYLNTGDGIATFLFFLKILKDQPDIIDYVQSNFFEYPQILVNRKVSKKPNLMAIPAVKSRYEEIRRRFGTEGRIVLRYSGTEPKLRVMIEGRNIEFITRAANDFADFIKEVISRMG